MILFRNGVATKTIIGALPKRKILKELELEPVEPAA